MGTEIISQKQKNLKTKNNTKDFDVDQFMETMGWGGKKQKKIDPLDNIRNITNSVESTDDILKKSVIKPGFEKLKKVKQYDISDRKLRERRKRNRERTKGKKWYGLPATEMTDEVKHDLEVIQMRSVLDPKRFYKKNDLKVLPKYFQIGKVIDTPQDFYSSRLTNKERKRTIVDELLSDAEFAKFNKRKYKQIIEEKQKTDYKAWRRAQKLQRKNK